MAPKTGSRKTDPARWPRRRRRQAAPRDSLPASPPADLRKHFIGRLLYFLWKMSSLIFFNMKGHLSAFYLKGRLPSFHEKDHISHLKGRLLFFGLKRKVIGPFP